MDSSVEYGPQVPEPTHCRFHQFHHHNSGPHRHRHRHHHHHFQVSPNCPFHSFMLHLKNHSSSCPNFPSSFPQSQNPETLDSVPFPRNPFDLPVSQTKEKVINSSLVMQEDKNVEMEEEVEHQEEEDPVFVLTDEWREFFAKSEAKRRLARKQARRKGKNGMEQ